MSRATAKQRMPKVGAPGGSPNPKLLERASSARAGAHDLVTITLVCILIFAAILASGLFGLFVQHRLPEAQKSDSARVIIGQISGVLSLLLSLVLGTLVGTSFAFQTTQKTELDALAAQVLELDQTLGELGPTGAFARERLKQTIETPMTRSGVPGRSIRNACPSRFRWRRERPSKLFSAPSRRRPKKRSRRSPP